MPITFTLGRQESPTPGSVAPFLGFSSRRRDNREEVGGRPDGKGGQGDPPLSPPSCLPPLLALSEEGKGRERITP